MRFTTYHTIPIVNISVEMTGGSLCGVLLTAKIDAKPIIIRTIEKIDCSLNFLLVSWTVFICTPAAIVSRAVAIGAPHLGQDAALSDTS